jgi:hypothetical protein
MKEKVFKNSEKAQDILIDQGPLVSGLIMLAGTIVIVGIGIKVTRVRKFFIKQKNKLMWSSVLRA